MLKKLCSRKNDIYYWSLFVLALFSAAKSIHFVSQSGIADIIDLLELPFLAAIVAACFVRESYRLKELAAEIAVLGLLVIGYLVTGYAALTKGAFFIIAARNTDFLNICKWVRRGFSCAFLLSVILFLTGVSRVENVRRGFSSLGFSHPNVCSAILLMICILWYLEKSSNGMSLRFGLTLLLVAVLDFFIANSRTAVLLFIALPVLAAAFLWIEKRWKMSKAKKVFLILVVLTPLIMLFLSLFTALLLPYSKLLQGLDSLLNGRIYLNFSNITRHGISLFGQSIEFSTGESIFNPITGSYSTYNTVDNTYVSLLLQMGIVPTDVYILAAFGVMWKALNQQYWGLLVAEIVICLFAFMESLSVDILYHIPLLFLLSNYRPGSAEKRDGSTVLQRIYNLRGRKG